MGVSKNRGTPKWMVKIMENPIKMDDLGVPLFLETPTSITNQESNFHTGVTKKTNCISSYHPMEMRLVQFWLGFTSSRIPDQKKTCFFPGIPTGRKLARSGWICWLDTNRISDKKMLDYNILYLIAHWIQVYHIELFKNALSYIFYQIM